MTAYTDEEAAAGGSNAAPGPVPAGPPSDRPAAASAPTPAGPAADCPDDDCEVRDDR